MNAVSIEFYAAGLSDSSEKHEILHWGAVLYLLYFGFE